MMGMQNKTENEHKEKLGFFCKGQSNHGECCGFLLSNSLVQKSVRQSVYNNSLVSGDLGLFESRESPDRSRHLTGQLVRKQLAGLANPNAGNRRWRG